MKRIAICALSALTFFSCQPGEPEPSAARLTYAKDVAPVMVESCVSCHREGGIAPFALETYEQVKALAPAIVATTAARTMPPVIADVSGDCQDFVNQPHLSEDQLQMLSDWADSEMLEGDSADLPAPFVPLAPLDGDLLLDIGVEYTPNDDEVDDYRCFVIENDNEVDRFISAYEVIPGDPRVVHHVVIYSPDSDAAADEARALDANDALPGYQCFGSANVSSSLIAGWAPGAARTDLPPTTGIRAPAGRPIIVQMHYNTANGVFADRTQIVMKTEASVENEAFGMFIGTFNFRLDPGLDVETANHVQTLNGLPGGGLKLWGIFPHMHTLGRTMRFEKTTGSETTCLTDVPRYSFDWQQYFYYDEPMILNNGDQLRLDCTYDTTSRDTPPFSETERATKCVWSRSTSPFKQVAKDTKNERWA